MHPHQIAPTRSLASSDLPSSTSASSPQVLTPATSSTVNKPLAPMPSSVNKSPISTNKTWILPPKPKPGRKPAIDTAPTKRKAQNREAQRAFRERRAAKVGEMEDEMKKMEEEDAREQNLLRERIKQLESSVESYSNMIETWRQKFNEMQMACGRERQLREQAEREIEDLGRCTDRENGTISLPPRNNPNIEYVGQQLNSNPDFSGTEADKDFAEPTSMTCGKCSNDTRCQCIDEAFEMGSIADEASGQAFKRPHSPPSNVDNKRIRQTINADEDTEIDFTTQFSTRRPPALTTTASTSSSIAATAPLDPCGFCSNGSPCICAEMAKDRPRHQDTRPPPSHTPTLKYQYTSGISAGSDPCINGPGTCTQCLSNPTSTLLCKSVAAIRPYVTNETAETNETSTSAFPTGPVLSCADTFTTLSRHPAFTTATNELNTWVPQLTAVPKNPNASERTAYDIEAASVMSVLKFFDRRFGNEGEKATQDETRETPSRSEHDHHRNDRKETNSIAYEPEDPGNMNNESGTPKIYEDEHGGR